VRLVADDGVGLRVGVRVGVGVGVGVRLRLRLRLRVGVRLVADDGIEGAWHEAAREGGVDQVLI
jgi:hypothetical protein